VLGIGLALLALAAAAWVIGWVRYGDIPERTSREASDVRDRFAAEVDVPGETTVDLHEGRYLVYLVVPRGTGTRDEEYDLDGAAAAVDIELRSPDGDVVPPADPDPDGASTDVFKGSDTRFELVLAAEYEVRGGDHVLTVDGEPTEGVTVAGIVEAVDPHAGADAILAGGALFVLGLLVGGLGLVVALVGGVWLLVVRSASAERAPVAPR
jgi:hypothetical protein